MNASFPITGLRGLGVMVAVGLALGAAAPLAAQNTTPPPAPGSASEHPEDLLRPGDMVLLRVWREAAFSGEYPVDRNGMVVLPRLGAIPATDVPTTELRERILQGLSQYLRNPSIEVIFQRRIAIHGAVTAAGLYPVDPTMTVLDVLALAGGARHDGRLDRIRLVRDGEIIATIQTTGVRMEDLRIRSGDQLFVPEQTWVRRNTGLLATLSSAAVSLFIALLYISQG